MNRQGQPGLLSNIIGPGQHCLGQMELGRAISTQSCSVTAVPCLWQLPGPPSLSACLALCLACYTHGLTYSY